MNKIGIMQGRLSARIDNRLQAFPWSSWEKEFEIARECQLDLIEWLFDAEDYPENPLWTEQGIRRIKQQIEHSWVQVLSCCAHYFMVHPFFRVPESERLESIDVLERLIAQSAELGIKTILIPVLENCEIRSELERSQLIEALSEPLALASRHGISLGLETELPAADYRALVDQANHPRLGIYYDTGNNTARGHDIAADTRLLAPLFVGVHIKDRSRGGPNVLLGQGEADFAGFFTSLRNGHYNGPLILETTFGNDPIQAARTHRNFVYNYLQVV